MVQRNRWRLWIPFRLIGFVLLAYILSTVDLGDVVARLAQIGAEAVAAAAAAYLILLAFRCLRWHQLSQIIWPAARFRRSCFSCNEGTWMGMVTPGRVGEFQRAIHLSHDSGKGLATTSGLLLLDLGLEVFTYASFGLAGVLLLMLGGTVMGISVYVFCILTSFLCLLMVRLPIAFALRWVPFVGRVPGFPHLLPALVVGLRGNTALRVAAISFGMALAYSQMIMTLTAPMNLNLSFVEYLTMVGIVGISGAIPISYFGFGTREIALIWYFGFLGLDTPTAIAVSFTFVLAQLLGTVLSVCLGFGLGRLVPGAARISP